MRITYVRADSSTPWRGTNKLGVGTQTPLREPFPDFADVLTIGQSLVGLNDRVSGIEKAG